MNVRKCTKSKSFKSLLENWSAGRCPDVCWKAVPSWVSSDVYGMNKAFSSADGRLECLVDNLVIGCSNSATFVPVGHIT